MASAFCLIGSSVVLAGASKLAAPASYRKLVADLDWSEDQMVRVGLAEIVGGALMMLPPTRRIGAAVVAATSLAVLQRELDARRSGLAAPRLGIFVAAVGALLAP